MTEIVDLKTRRKTKAPVDEPDVTPKQFLETLLNDEALADVRGMAVITWDEDGAADYSHLNATWAELFWYAHQLAQYASEPEYEDDDD